MPPRLFTLEEATALLPRLTELLQRLQVHSQEVTRLSGELDDLGRPVSTNGHSASSNGHSSGGGREGSLREARQKAVDAAQVILSEIQELGCELKGIEQGLIDFPSHRDGRTVYLCWRLGEDKISYWHDLDTGFAGRQPL